MSGLNLTSLLNNIMATLGRQVGAGVLQLLTVILISRIYGAQGNGTYTLALLLPTLLATLLNLGIAPANVYYLGSGKYPVNIVWKSSLRIALIISLFGLLIGGLVIFSLGHKWFPNIPSSMLWLALISFPILFILSILSSVFQGLQKFKELNLVLLIQPFLTISLVMCLTIVNINDIAWIIGMYILASLCTLLLGIRMLIPLLNIGQKHNQWSKSASNKYIKEAMNYGYKAHLSNILAFLNYKADLFLVNLYLGVASAGIYIVAVQLTEKMWLLSQAISTVILPRLSELSGDEESRKLLTPLVTRWTLWLTIIASVVLAIFASFIIYILFGEDFLTATPVLWWLLPGITLTAGSRVLANDIAARGRPELNMYTSIMVLIVNIIGNIILIPIFGIVGAAIATTISYTLNFLLTIFIHNYFTEVPFRKNLILEKNDFYMLKTFFKKGLKKFH